MVPPVSAADFEYRWIRGSTNIAYALGAPSFITSDTGTNADTVLGSKALGIDGFSFVDVIAYTTTLMDSKTGIESDTSRFLYLSRDVLALDVDKNITIGIPLPPSSRYYRLIYRFNLDANNSPEPTQAQEFIPFFNQTFFAVDTIIDPLVTEYYDTLGPVAQELNNDDYDRTLPEALLNGAIIHEGQMYAWDDFTVYQSKTDTAEFPFFQNGQFDLDDGDRIVYVSSYEGFIVVYKSNSEWIMFTSNGTVFDRRKASKGIGMIAEHSFDSYGEDNIYLGPRGIFRESDSRRRDNKALRDPTSDPIKDILLRPVDDMKDAFGIVYNDLWLLSYPGTDTSYVYFFKHNAFGLFTFDFDSAVLYDTINSGPSQTNFRDLYFVKDDDELIFIFDQGDTTDAGADFIATYEKEYLFRHPNTLSIFDHIVVQTEGIASDADSLTFILNDENNGLLGTFKIGLDSVYRRGEMAPLNNKTFHHLNLKIEAPNKPNLYIKAIDLFSTDAGIDRR